MRVSGKKSDALYYSMRHCMSSIHAETITNTWSHYTLSQQMSSVASEFSRLSSWCEKGNLAVAKKSADRTIDLINAMLHDVRWKGRELEFKNLKIMVEAMVEAKYFGKVSAEPVVRSLAPFFSLAALA